MRSRRPRWSGWPPDPPAGLVPKLWRSTDLKPLPARVAANLATVLKSLPQPVLGPEIDEEAWWNDVQADPLLTLKARGIREEEPRPTLEHIMRAPYWVWASCERIPADFICGHKAPIALVPFLIRWGPNASSDLIRMRLRCSKCGRLGCSLTVPSWGNMQTEWQLFPVERMPGYVAPLTPSTPSPDSPNE